MATQTETCPRCCGTGQCPQWSHRWGGLCLLCRGKGTIRRRTRGRMAAREEPAPPEEVGELPDWMTDVG